MDNGNLWLTLAAIFLSSSVAVAFINWLKDIRVNTATAENLSTLSMREALVTKREEMAIMTSRMDEQTAELRKCREALDQQR